MAYSDYERGYRDGANYSPREDGYTIEYERGWLKGRWDREKGILG